MSPLNTKKLDLACFLRISQNKETIYKYLSGKYLSKDVELHVTKLVSSPPWIGENDSEIDDIFVPSPSPFPTISPLAL